MRRIDDGGSTRYLPPSLLHPKAETKVHAETGEQVDVWSAGVIVGKMLWREGPWRGVRLDRNAYDWQRDEDVERILHGWPFDPNMQRRSPRRGRDPPLCLEELVNRCLHPDARRRPTAAQVRVGEVIRYHQSPTFLIWPAYR